MKYAIDFYSGIGGWTLGMKLSNITNMASFEWWNEANQTHNLNFDTNHKEIDIRKINVSSLSFDHQIDFVVGSPPCTQFSYANKGGNGDLADGMIDILKFLEIVEHVKPRYWAMENVPRVAKIIQKEINGGVLSKFKHLFSAIEIVDSSEYGVPQRRKRMIAGNFPVELFRSYKTKIKPKHLGDVIKDLSRELVVDTNYGYEISRKNITELENEADLTMQEERINCDAKSYHPIYNGMSFPDKLDRPSRTITATCTRVSRESIIVKSETGFRRLNVRERGVIQGFPITYQFYGRTLNSKFKMIGNAVPPILTYFLFQSMKEVELDDLKLPSESSYYHEQPHHKPFTSKLGLPKRKFPASRKFMHAVPSLRFGSGVRFELSNNPKINQEWTFKFIYGNSKNIKNILLSTELADSIASVFTKKSLILIDNKVKEMELEFREVTHESLQLSWISTVQNTYAFDFLDAVGLFVKDVINEISFNENVIDLLANLLEDNSKKVKDNYRSIFVGLYYLSRLNEKVISFERHVHEENILTHA